MRKKTNGLRHISQVHKILKGFKEEGLIVDYNSIQLRVDDVLESLNYRVFYNTERFFDFILRFAKTFHPIGGAEIGESKYSETIVLVGSDCEPKRIKRLLRTEIVEHQGGINAEEFFQKDVETLIANDREVSEIIDHVRMSTIEEDKVEKIDKIFVLKTGEEVPIQIKSGIFQQKRHKREHGNIPSLVYARDLLRTGLLKNYILKICLSYKKNIIESF